MRTASSGRNVTVSVMHVATFTVQSPTMMLYLDRRDLG